MVNNCVVPGCVVGTAKAAKQNVTLREFPKASRQDASYGGAFRIGDSKRLGSRRVTPMCAVHTSFLLTLLTMSNASQRNESSTRLLSQPCFHQNARFRNAHSVSRWTPRAG